MLGEGALDLLSAALAVGVGARGTQDGAAEWEDVLHVRQTKRLDQSLHRTPPSVSEADDLVAVDLDAFAGDRPDHRIEAGAVTASGQHADAHVDSPFPYPLAG
jgi:hypothetical protein